jgi:hypothetical protein
MRRPLTADSSKLRHVRIRNICKSGVPPAFRNAALFNLLFLQPRNCRSALVSHRLDAGDARFGDVFPRPESSPAHHWLIARNQTLTCSGRTRCLAGALCTQNALCPPTQCIFAHRSAVARIAAASSRSDMRQIACTDSEELACEHQPGIRIGSLTCFGDVRDFGARDLLEFVDRAAQGRQCFSRIASG